MDTHVEAPLGEKTVAIIIYGMVAVGKLTVAKALQKETGYKLTHNHLINDLVWSIFDRGTIESNRLAEKLRYELYETAVKSRVSIIITHTYSNDYVSVTGLSDPDYLKSLEERLETAGAKTLFVYLQTDKQTLLDRVEGESRKEHRKLMDVAKMTEYFDAKLDTTTSAPVKNNLVIDNTNLTPENVASLIVKELAQLES